MSPGCQSDEKRHPEWIPNYGSLHQNRHRMIQGTVINSHTSIPSQAGMVMGSPGLLFRPASLRAASSYALYPTHMNLYF